MNIEQVKDATTPEEMRAEIYRLQHYDPLVRNVMDASGYMGWSAEDRYTVLAYNALKQRALFQGMVLDYKMTHLEPCVIPVRLRAPPN